MPEPEDGAGRRAQTAAHAGVEAITHRPPNQMGLPTPATIGNRMGNTFGTSAYPQRPSP